MFFFSIFKKNLDFDPLLSILKATFKNKPTYQKIERYEFFLFFFLFCGLLFFLCRPQEFSWFIYRVTNPTIRDMFMHPQNMFNVKQGLMSLLAADLQHGARYRRSLFMFKVMYYLVSLLNWRRTHAGWKRHRFNIRDMGPLRGETIQRADGSARP